MIEKSLENEFSVPELVGEADWVELVIPDNFGSGRQFITGDIRADRIRLKYYKRQHDNALMARIWFGPAAEGPVGHVHGGSMAALLDESMGLAVLLTGSIAFTAKLTVYYRKMLSLGSVVTLEAKVKSISGRKVLTSGRIFNDKDEIISSGEGFFIKSPINKIEEHNIEIKTVEK
jgi:acyl-coenzyme A thioesterase PaaI-like protein